MEENELKRLIIDEYLSGDISLRNLGVKYHCDHNLIYRWVMSEKKQRRAGRLVKHAAAVAPSPDLKIESTDVAWLQQELRLARIRVSLLEATIDIADEQYGTNLRKKAGARRS